MENYEKFEKEVEDLEVIDDESVDEPMKMTEEEVIAKLLAEDDSAPEKTVFIKSKGIPITVKGLTEKEIANVRKESTKKVKINGRREQQLDDADFSAGIVEKASVSPNFNDPRLLNKLKVSSGKEYIKRTFMGGVLDALCEVVMDLSGYNEDVVEIKN